MKRLVKIFSPPMTLSPIQNDIKTFITISLPRVANAVRDNEKSRKDVVRISLIASSWLLPLCSLEESIRNDDDRTIQKLLSDCSRMLMKDVCEINCLCMKLAKRHKGFSYGMFHELFANPTSVLKQFIDIEEHILSEE